jgi:hypothetical protein
VVKYNGPFVDFYRFDQSQNLSPLVIFDIHFELYHSPLWFFSSYQVYLLNSSIVLIMWAIRCPREQSWVLNHLCLNFSYPHQCSQLWKQWKVAITNIPPVLISSINLRYLYPSLYPKSLLGYLKGFSRLVYQSWVLAPWHILKTWSTFSLWHFIK